MAPSRIAIAVLVSGLVLVGVAGAAAGPLHGSVGPGFTITLADGSGAEVSQLDPGTFALTVDDESDEHNFHLQGPGGVNVATTVEEVAQKTFSVTLVDGKYTFICDAHPTRMAGTFTVGTPPPAPKPPPAKPPTRLILTVTGRAVSLTTPAGKPVRALPAGRAVVTVRDRSAIRGARLTGAGVRRSTAVKFVGTLTWKVELSPGKLVFASDARKPVLRGGRVTVS